MLLVLLEIRWVLLKGCGWGGAKGLNFGCHCGSCELVVWIGGAALTKIDWGSGGSGGGCRECGTVRKKAVGKG